VVPEDRACSPLPQSRQHLVRKAILIDDVARAEQFLAVCEETQRLIQSGEIAVDV